jgi:segregation and condensation protein A
MMADFAVKVRDFEGPLDLLLSLIEDRKLLVNDVSISKVADDFLTYIQSKGGFPLAEASHFVLISATLLLLKSRSLLPVLSLTHDEEEDIHDLEFRLRIYQAVRVAARNFPNGSERIFFGSGARITDPLFTPPTDLSMQAVDDAIRRVLQNAPKKELVPEITVQSVVSLEEMMMRLEERIQKAFELSFSDFAKGSSDKREVVVSFLAMLELTKRGLLLVTQESSFGDIKMSYSGEIGNPRYD